LKSDQKETWFNSFFK